MATVELAHEAPLDKGLKTGALGFVSSVVIGVTSTAPGYSLGAGLPRRGVPDQERRRRPQRPRQGRLGLPVEQAPDHRRAHVGLRSTQTTILPTARTTLSMAAHGALPRYFARIHPRFRTLGPSTLWMGALSIAWYVGLTIASENILTDSIDALGLMIAFYYDLTGFACAWYYRRHLLDSARNFLLVGVVPVAGRGILTWLFVKSIIDLSNPANTSTGSDSAGLGAPIWIAIGSLILGLVIIALQWKASPAFFRRRPETGDPSVFADAAAAPSLVN
jgi:amino acid transporter